MFFEELEYKYRASGIKLTEFESLMQSDVDVVKKICVGSWDIYYVNQADENSQQRFRMDRENPELTKKVKEPGSANNWVRIESDLPLDKDVHEKQVAFHVGLDGYKENFRIFKVCSIFITPILNYVYYVVLDENLERLDNFIEVEVNKSQVPKLNARIWEEGKVVEGGAMLALREGEKVLSKLGITAQHRLKKSLFELYRKGSK